MDDHIDAKSKNHITTNFNATFNNINERIQRNFKQILNKPTRNRNTKKYFERKYNTKSTKKKKHHKNNEKIIKINGPTKRNYIVTLKQLVTPQYITPRNGKATKDTIYKCKTQKKRRVQLFTKCSSINFKNINKST